MGKIRKTLEKINNIGFIVTWISIILIIIDCILIFTIDYYGVFSWISIGMVGLSGLLTFGSYIVLEALPKEDDEITNRVAEAEERARKIALERLVATPPNTIDNSNTRTIKTIKQKLEEDLSKVSRPAKKRAGVINDYLRWYPGSSLVPPVSKIFVLESKKIGNREKRSYLLVLGHRYKSIEEQGRVAISLEERLKSFDEFLKRNLLDGEKIYYEDEAICINSKYYDIYYYIEAYRKEPDKKCYIDFDGFRVEALENNSAAKAFYELKHTYGVHSDIVEKVFLDMNSDDYEFIYPNARTRFVALCEKYKALYKDAKPQKVNKFGQRIYPMSYEEEKIYNRLMKEYPQEAQMIEQELLKRPENRNWELLEDMIVNMF